MRGWCILIKAMSYAEASIVKGMLEKNSIRVQVLNKMDNNYLNFGEIEIYVPMTLKEIATGLLNKALLN